MINLEKKKYTVINIVEPVSEEEKRDRLNRALKIMVEAERRAQAEKDAQAKSS